MDMQKQENAAADATAAIASIAELFGAAGMVRLADSAIYRGIPQPCLLALRAALESQVCEEKEKRFKNRMRYAGILKERTIHTFKWDSGTYPLAEPGVIEQALALDFIRQRRNFIMIGPSGTGKTLFAVILACNAIREGFSVKYKSAHDIFVELQEARDGNCLSGYIKRMQAYDMLVIEDITYSAPDLKTAHAFFSIIDKRYSRKSTLVTSNGNIREWVSSFPEKDMCPALLGRISEDAVLFNMNGAIDMRVELANGMLGAPARSAGATAAGDVQ